MKTRRAFTLIELLVVISVLALLVGILLPSFRRAREQGKRTVCGAHLHQIGVAFQAYLETNEQRLPFASYMPSVGPSPLDLDEDPIYAADVLMPFVSEEKRVFRCPSDRPGVVERKPPNSGKSYYESERSSYEYRTGWWRKDFSIMGHTPLEAAKLLERVYHLKVPDNTFWIMRDYNNFHAAPSRRQNAEGQEYEGSTHGPGGRRYLYSDGHVGDYENI